MTAVLIILLCISLGVAAAGVFLLLPSRRRKEIPPSPGPVSPESMIQVKPAGPGRLRMSFPQGDRMPLEVMLQIVEVKEETDLDKLRDPARSVYEKQQVVDRLRSLGYEIAYDPFPGEPEEDGVATMTAQPEEEAPDPGPEDSGEEEVDPVTLRPLGTGVPVTHPGGNDFSDFFRDTEALHNPDTPLPGGSAPGTDDIVPEDEYPTEEDERLRSVAEDEGLGGGFAVDFSQEAEEGPSGRKAIALMEFIASCLKEGSISPELASFAEERLQIRIIDVPWRKEGRALRDRKDFRPLDESVRTKSLDEFDLYVREEASRRPRPVTVSDLRHGGRRDLAWDRLDNE